MQDHAAGGQLCHPEIKRYLISIPGVENRRMRGDGTFSLSALSRVIPGILPPRAGELVHSSRRPRLSPFIPGKDHPVFLAEPA